jgi:hypothetical protein
MEQPPSHDPDKTIPGMAIPEFGTETREYHPDIMELVEVLNRETYDLYAPDGYVRTGLKVKTLERNGDIWMITLFNPQQPFSANDTVTMSLGQFEKERGRPVIETPRQFTETTE